MVWNGNLILTRLNLLFIGNKHTSDGSESLIPKFPMSFLQSSIIHKFLIVDTPVLVENAMVNSQLDYYIYIIPYYMGSARAGLLNFRMIKMCSAIWFSDRTVCHVTPCLEKLHWLPISSCIFFKYNLLIFKAITFSQPLYLSSLIRSSSLIHGNRLSVYSIHPRKAIPGVVLLPWLHQWHGRYGTRLPLTVRSQQTTSSFISQLKTCLFGLSYPPPP